MTTRLEKIVRPNEFDASRITLTPPRKRDDRTVVYLNYGEHRSWAWESPWLRAPFSASSYEKGDTGRFDYSLPLQAVAKNPDEQEEVNHFFEQFHALDDKVVEFAQKYSKMLLGKQYTTSQIEVVRALCGKCVKTSDNYPDRISPKIPKMRGQETVPNVVGWKGSADNKICPKTFQEIIDNVPKMSYVKCILRGRFWVVGGKCGVSLFMVQIVFPEDTGLDAASSCAFGGTTFKTKPVDTSESKSETEAEAEAEELLVDSDSAEASEEHSDEAEVSDEEEVLSEET